MFVDLHRLQKVGLELGLEGHQVGLHCALEGEGGGVVEWSGKRRRLHVHSGEILHSYAVM